MTTTTTPSIPEEVLNKIAAHRPHLRAIIRNIAAHPSMARGLERDLATAYLLGETKLTAMETWHLACCTDGRRYGDHGE